jgi:mRNA-degrading endonuclease RelE of RelBE toxin-antitoxin system
MNSSENYSLYVTNLFIKEARKLKNRYPDIKKSFNTLKKDLKVNPIGRAEAHIGKDCYKVRMEIEGKHAGRSYGAKVIIYVKVINKIVYLLSVYDKSDKQDLDVALEELLTQKDEPVKGFGN